MGEVLPVFEYYMREALSEASKAKGQTAPNPPVGAVVVDKNNKIIGRGFHPMAGSSHAEVFAIEEALKSQKDLSQCRIFITLEPCNHFGRTPPCLDLILKHKFQNVVIGSIDPNPKMSGQSIEVLKAQGVKVTEGILQSECDKLIRGFKSVMQTGRPFVSLKCAVSLDGKIATENGDSKWITSLESRKYVHQLRSESDGVLVGIGTVLKDNPRLDARDFDPQKKLKKIILDARLQVPENSQIFKSSGEVILFCDENYSASKKRAFEERGIKVFPVPSFNGYLDLKEVLEKLVSLGVQELFVEGGAAVLGSFLKENLFDNLIYFIAPKIIGERGRSVFAGFHAPTLVEASFLKNIKVRSIGTDFIFEGEAGTCSQV